MYWHHIGTPVISTKDEWVSPQRATCAEKENDHGKVSSPELSDEYIPYIVYVAWLSLYRYFLWDQLISSWLLNNTEFTRVKGISGVSDEMNP